MDLSKSTKMKIYLRFVYLVKLLSNRCATASPKNYENTSDFKGWGLALVAYKKKKV